MVKQILVFLTLIHVLGTIAHENDYKALAKRARDLTISWLDKECNQQEALVKLSIMFNRGELKDLPHKKKIFEILIQNSIDELFLNQSVLFLSRLGIDNDVLQQCKRLLTSHSPSRNALIASLSYLSENDIQSFNSFFVDKSYLALDDSIKKLFSYTPIVKEKREVYLAEALASLTTVRQVQNSAQATDVSPQIPENFAQLLKEWNYIPEFINVHKKDFMTPALSLEILYLLGEIHSNESFELLLENFILSPNFRSAITLACCTGSLQIKTLFNTLSKAGKLNEYLKEVLTSIPGGGWDIIKNDTPEEQFEFYRKNYEDILLKVIQRAKTISD